MVLGRDIADRRSVILKCVFWGTVGTSPGIICCCAEVDKSREKTSKDRQACRCTVVIMAMVVFGSEAVAKQPPAVSFRVMRQPCLIYFAQQSVLGLQGYLSFRITMRMRIP
jgi:hypothetical protein